MLRYSIMVFIGLFAIVTGLVVFFLLADATRKAILDAIVIDSAGHKNYDDWLTSWDADDQATYYDYYMWNLTNPVAFASGAAKAMFAEVGPFVYRSYGNKTNVTFNDGGNSVSFRTHTEFHFQQDMSVSSDVDTMIYNINPFYVTAVAATSGSEAVFDLNLAAAAFNAFNNASQFGTFGLYDTSTTTATFWQYAYSKDNTKMISLTDAEAEAALTAFTGNVAKLAVYAATVKAYSEAYVASQAATLTAVGASLNASFPGCPDFWTFFPFNGLYASKASIFAEYAVAVGAGGRAGLITAGAGSSSLLFRKISVHAHLFGPDPLYAMLQSGASAGYVTNHTVRTQVGNQDTVKTGKDSSSVAGMDHYTELNGVTTSTAYHKVDGSGPTVVVNGRSNSMAPFQGATPDKIETYFEENERYAPFTFNGVQEVEEIETARYLGNIKSFVAESVDFNVTHQGFAPLSYWASGAEFYLSAPHQYFAATPFSTAIDGMAYSAATHSTYLDLEPITGLPLQARLAIQMNLKMNFTSTTYADASNVSNKDMQVPLYWFNKHYRITADGAKSLRKAVVTAVVLRRAILGSLVGLGVVCVLIGAALMVQKGGNEGVSGDGKDANEGKKDNSSNKQQESELPPDNEPELQPFHPPPAVTGEDDQEMDNVGPK